MSRGFVAATVAPLVKSAAWNGLAALLLLLSAAAVLQRQLELGAGYLPKVVVTFGVVITLGAAFLHQHDPRTRFGPANQVTLLRGLLAALLGGLAGEGGGDVLGWTAFVLALSAEGLDAVDGWLARRLGWASPFGARFDMEVDAVLVAVLSLLVWSLDKAGPWVLAAGLMRYAFVASGRVWPWLRRPLPRSRRRQLGCVVQVLTLTAALAPAVTWPWSAATAALGLAFLCFSFLADVVWLARAAVNTEGDA